MEDTRPYQIDGTYFFGKDPILGSDFLMRFIRDANNQEMFEAQPLITVPSTIYGFGESQFEARVEMVSTEKVVYSAGQQPYDTFSGIKRNHWESVQQPPASKLYSEELWN